jgi:hypothetical protein
MLKTKTERLLVLVVAFLAGCEASRLANVVVPPAHAGEPVQRWEYACPRPERDSFAGTWRPETFEALANKFGREGWELATGAGAGSGAGVSQSETIIFCFKRPLGAAPVAQ